VPDTEEPQQTEVLMSPSRPHLSEYKGMWLFVLFDLPVQTKKARKLYTRFRKYLISEAFSMLQFSVYARYFRSEDSSASLRRKITEKIPPDGRVRLLLVTDHQFGKMEVFFGKQKEPAETQPKQLLLF
jgi:CRISPR-associated protein Cas2